MTHGRFTVRYHLRQVVHTHVILSPSSIDWYWTTGQKAVMPYGWEGKRRSGVAVAMCHRLSVLSIYRLKQ